MKSLIIFTGIDNFNNEYRHHVLCEKGDESECIKAYMALSTELIDAKVVNVSEWEKPKPPKPDWSKVEEYLEDREGEILELGGYVIVEKETDCTLQRYTVDVEGIMMSYGDIVIIGCVEGYSGEYRLADVVEYEAELLERAQSAIDKQECE